MRCIRVDRGRHGRRSWPWPEPRKLETTGSGVSKRTGGWTASQGVLTLRWADGEEVRVRHHLEDPSRPGTTAATMGKRLMLVTTAEGARSLWTYVK